MLAPFTDARAAIGGAVLGAALLGFDLWTRTRRLGIAPVGPGTYELFRGRRLLGGFAARDARAWPPIKETAQMIRGLLLYALVGGVGALLAFTDLPRAGFGVVAFAAVGFALLVRDRIALRHYSVLDQYVLLATRDARRLSTITRANSGLAPVASITPE